MHLTPWWRNLNKSHINSPPPPPVDKRTRIFSHPNIGPPFHKTHKPFKSYKSSFILINIFQGINNNWLYWKHCFRNKYRCLFVEIQLKYIASGGWTSLVQKRQYIFSILLIVTKYRLLHIMNRINIIAASTYCLA